MNKLLTWVLIITGLFGLCLLVFWIYVQMVFGGLFDARYTKQDLVNNYEKKNPEIREVARFINDIVPAGKGVTIEFENNNRLGIFHVLNNNVYESNWDVRVSSGKADTLLHQLGWTKQTLKALKEKLDKANCISVESGDPATIGFKRSGMGKYSYKIFSGGLNDSQVKEYNDSCSYIYYGKNVVLEYGGGAIGPQCFESFYENR